MIAAGASAARPTTALYVPGDRPDRFEKAAASGADIVILDLEDAVAPGAKGVARRRVVDWLVARAGSADVSAAVQVRVNAVDTPWFAEDMAALPVDVAVRLPKVESDADVDAVGAREVNAILESALGVERAFEIAGHERVTTVALGEADLSADLGLTAEAALTWIRVRLVVAARAAGLPAPMMSAYPEIPDLEGLARSCVAGRALGMHGRTAIHPSQIPVIASAFAATHEEVEWARSVIAALDSSDGGVSVLPGGAMVDAAMARRAIALLASAGG